MLIYPPAINAFKGFLFYCSYYGISISKFSISSSRLSEVVSRYQKIIFKIIIIAKKYSFLKD